MAKRPRSGVHQAASADHPPRRGPAAAAVPQEPSELDRLRAAHEALQAEAAELRATVAEAEALLGRNFQRSKAFRKLRRLQEAPFVGPTAAQGPAAMRQAVRTDVAVALKDAASSRKYRSRSATVVDRPALLLEEAVVAHDVVPSLVFEYVVAPFVAEDFIFYEPARGDALSTCLFVPGHTSPRRLSEVLRGCCPDDVLSTDRPAAERVLSVTSGGFRKDVLASVIDCCERDAKMDEHLAIVLFRLFYFSPSSRFPEQQEQCAKIVVEILVGKMTEFVTSPSPPSLSSSLTLPVMVDMMEAMVCYHAVCREQCQPQLVMDVFVGIFHHASADLAIHVSLIRMFRALVQQRRSEKLECLYTEEFRDRFLLPAATLELPERAATDLLDGVQEMCEASRIFLTHIFCTVVVRDRFCIPLAARGNSDKFATSLLRSLGRFMDDFDFDDPGVVAGHLGVVFLTAAFRDQFFGRIASMIETSSTAQRFVFELITILRFAALKKKNLFATKQFRAAVGPVLDLALGDPLADGEEDAFVRSTLGFPVVAK